METQAQFLNRTKWWREAKFGMFIHWGIYSVPADNRRKGGGTAIAEWYLSNQQVQVADYAKFAAQFNPVKFNARQWVSLAKEAGMKYLVITSKHHDGFCMFDTKLTDYNIVKASPYGRDPMKDLAAECKRQGIKLCFYYSIMDWHHPDYLPRRPWESGVRPAAGANMDRYIDYMKGQIKELLTNYGPIGILWFDGQWEHDGLRLRSPEVNQFIRSLQPNIIINDRNHEPQDYATPEQFIPANALPAGRLWETCMTMNDTWGYAKDDHNWKPSSDLIQKLTDILHKGGNFLLNVGPTAEGEIPQPSIARLREVGEWMKKHSEAVYGTTASPIKRLGFDGRCAAKGKTLYVFAFNRAHSLSLPNTESGRIVGARWLTTGETIRIDEGALSQPKSLHPAATVARLDYDRPPTFAPFRIRVSEDGSYLLRAMDAELNGRALQYEIGRGHDNIGYWSDPKDYVSWQLGGPSSGEYEVEIKLACPASDAGATYTVGVENGDRISGVVSATGSWIEPKSFVLGRIKIDSQNPVISVRIEKMGKGAAMNLWSVKLTPK